METIRERYAYLEERQEVLEREALALSHEREAIGHLIIDVVDAEEYRSLIERQEALLARHLSIMEELVEHRHAMAQFIEEFDTESDDSDDTDYSDLSTSGYTDETFVDDEIGIKMICTCDWRNVEEKNLF